jgi:hypothetical protein
MSQLIVPVTDKLALALHRTYALMGVLEKKLVDDGPRTTRVNDKTTYKDLVDQLEDLTVVALGTTSVTSLVNAGSPKGARIDISSETLLYRNINRSVSYLRDTAGEVLASDLSTYNREHVNVVWPLLRDLYYDLIRSIRNQAVEDLDRLMEDGPNSLILAAEQLGR